MKKDNECDLRKIAASIAVLWDPLTDAQRNYLVDSMEVKVYEKNEVIYREHEEPQCLMCLLDGKVKVYKEGIGSGTQIIRMIKEQKVTAITGKDIPLKADSICVHGDGAKALAFVAKIRETLTKEGIEICPLAQML